MSFAGAVAAAGRGLLEEYPASYVRAMRPTLIRVGLGEGYSGAEIQRQLQAVGLGMRSQDFYSVVGEIAASEAAGQNIGSVSLSDLPELSDFTDWQVVRGSGYVYQMQFHYLVRDELGRVVERGTMPFSLRSGTLLVPGEAIQEAFDILHQGDERYPRIILGGEITGLYNMVPG